MSKLSKFGKRQKNKFQRELEEIALELTERYIDDYDWGDDIEEIDDWSLGWNCSDEPDYTEIWIKLIPGTHVKTKTDYWLVTTCGFANLRTGEIKSYIGKYEIIYR